MTTESVADPLWSVDPSLKTATYDIVQWHVAIFRCYSQSAAWLCCLFCSFCLFCVCKFERALLSKRMLNAAHFYALFARNFSLWFI